MSLVWHIALALCAYTSLRVLVCAQEVPVATGKALQTALSGGARAVVLTEHLDVRQLTAQDGATFLITEDISIRGECNSAPPPAFVTNLDPAILPLEPGQCLILAAKLLFEIRSTTFAQVTMDNLYLRLEQFVIYRFHITLMAFSGTSVWLSNMTIQGDRGRHEALSPFKNAALHISGSTLANFNNTVGPLMSIEKNSSAVFERCTIRDISNPEVNGSAITAGSVDRTSRISSAVLIRDCTLANNTSPFFSFTETDGGTFYSDTPLQVFQDVFGKRVAVPAEDAADVQLGIGATFLREQDRPMIPDEPVAPPPVADPLVAPVDTISLPPVEPAADDPVPPSPVPPPADDAVNVGAVAGGIAAAAVAVLLVVAFILFRMKKKKDSKQKLQEPINPPIVDGSLDPAIGMGGADSEMRSTMPTDNSGNGSLKHPENGKPPHGVPPTGDPPQWHPSATPFAVAPGFVPQHPHDPYAYQNMYAHPQAYMHPQPYGGPPQPYGAPQQAMQPGAPGFQHPMPRFPSMQSWASGRSSGYNAAELRPMATTTFTAGSNWSDYQKAFNDSDSPLDALEVALDAMCSMKEAFYHRYMPLSSVERRVGGQGLVQFASIINTQDKAAIKFYMDRLAFQRERDLYQDSALKTMMPATLAIDENQSQQCRTPYGYVFPPFVIIECGQSLDEWSRDNMNKDFITIFQAMSHSVRALAKLHGTGYAHRDIKPGNILRRPKQHDWTLIDFGCAAQIGTTAGLAFSLKYAPPEVIHALESGCRTIHVDAAVDIWAIGVIAFELLTGERAFPVERLSAAEAEKTAQDSIAGRKALPWESMSDGVKERLGKMRGLKRTVLRCLERDPSKRPGAEALLKSWDHTFDDMQTRGTDWSVGSAETNQSSMPP